MPIPLVAFACGSASTRSVVRSAAARHAARFTAVVVLPTPPFWFVIVMILPTGSKQVRLREYGKDNAFPSAKQRTGAGLTYPIRRRRAGSALESCQDIGGTERIAAQELRRGHAAPPLLLEVKQFQRMVRSHHQHRPSSTRTVPGVPRTCPSTTILRNTLSTRPSCSAKAPGCGDIPRIRSCTTRDGFAPVDMTMFLEDLRCRCRRAAILRARQQDRRG